MTTRALDQLIATSYPEFVRCSELPFGLPPAWTALLDDRDTALRRLADDLVGSDSRCAAAIRELREVVLIRPLEKQLAKQVTSHRILLVRDADARLEFAWPSVASDEFPAELRHVCETYGWPQVGNIWGHILDDAEVQEDRSWIQEYDFAIPSGFVLSIAAASATSIASSTTRSG
jgi:hypothetical protein